MLKALFAALLSSAQQLHEELLMPPMSQGRKQVLFGLALIGCLGVGAAGMFLLIKPSASEQTQLMPAVERPTKLSKTDADTSLITRLIPSSEIRGVEKVEMGQGTWMWEIDMLADKANPKTAGFVYLSADGTKILNGPLMDKRSRIMSLPDEPTSGQAPHEYTEDESREAQGQQAPSPQQSPSAQSGASADAIAQKVKRAAAQREVFLSGIEQLPYMSTSKGSHPIYVLFDPLCTACAKLYKQHKAIAEAYDAEFRWIPIFNNEQSYPLSALLRKTYEENPTRGLEMLDQMLSKTWKAEEHFADIAALTEGDYGLVKPAAAVYLAITREIPGIGTPYVMFKNNQGLAEAFGGVPYSTDWASLKALK
ncbi:DsbA family protein [Pseudomonas sp. W22_MBD1_FP4]|uniref:DsbA family protein n=1 Tax=Pseudomonas sp. W22_MBD1_FP4 TaxID=3240272 RepID=UPI003F9881C4